ncbi:MAG: DUF5119 domain-containing protein [Bacteroidales bacterium]|nr:DUF5119 domain-containing protein [Bacteroidales bacterium]
MARRFVNIVIAAALVVLSMAACHRRPLEDMQERVMVRVRVNVNAIANITTNIYNPAIPVPKPTTDMMRVMVYDPGNKKLLTQGFIYDKEIDENGEEILSGNLNISFGDYDFVIYNFDTPTTQVKDENNEMSILAYTDEISPAMRLRCLGTKADDDYGTIDYEPDHLLVAREHDFRVSPHDTVIVISTMASTIVDTYYIQIRVEGAEFMADDGAVAVISGLAPSNRFGANVRTDDPSASVVFDLHRSTDPRIAGENKDVICAVFNTFGKIENANSDLHVTFSIKDVAGNYQTYDANLNSVFKTEDAIERHWLLLNEVFRIDPPTIEPQGGNGGFQPVVDEWEEEQGTITL